MTTLLRALCLSLIAAGAALAAEPTLPGKDAVPGQFPTGYRGWTHVKSALATPAFPSTDAPGGLHHIYANDKAMAGLRTGTFPDGAALVFDLLSVREKNGLVAEGPRHRVDVMVKESGAYPKSGGWWFGRFTGNDWGKEVLTPGQRSACFQCHQQPRARDYVISEFRK